MAEKPFETLKRVNQTILDATEVAFSKTSTDKWGKQSGEQIKKRTRLGYGVDATTGNQKRLAKLAKSYVLTRRGELFFWTNKETKQIFTTGSASGKKITGKARKSKGSKSLLGGLFGKSKSAKASTGKRKSKKEPRLKGLSNSTSPGKSNLTATGEMLDSIRGYGRKGKIILEIPDTPHGPSITNQQTELTNADLARVHQNGAIITHPSGVVIRVPQRRFFDLSNAEKKGLIRRVRQFILKTVSQRLA